MSLGQLCASALHRPQPGASMVMLQTVQCDSSNPGTTLCSAKQSAGQNVRKNKNLSVLAFLGLLTVRNDVFAKFYF
eukprot:4456118-Pleurochrysis_carterae.AAC.4